MFQERSLALETGASLNIARSSVEDPELILFHGLIRQWQDFAPFLPFVAGRWNLAAVDHRGHGKSARSAGAYRVVDYANDAARVVRNIATKPVTIYGHSLGALTAIAAAVANQELVRGIVLEDPLTSSFLEGIANTNYGVTWRAMRDLAGQNRTIPETTKALAAIQLPNGRTLGEVRDPIALRFLAKCLAGLDPQTLTTALGGDWLAGFDMIALAKKVRCPVLLLAGDPAAGSMLPTVDADELASTFIDACRVDFPGLGHLLHGEHPTAVAQVVLPFLESLE